MTDRLRTDAIAALRGLASTPGPVIWSVITVAVAAGLNLAMIGLADRALLSPPAHVANPHRLFTLGFVRSGDDAGAPMTTTSFASFETVRREVPAAADVAAFQRLSTGAVVDDMQVRVEAMLVSDRYFPLLGVRPVVGLGLESNGGDSATAVLSHAFWTRVFAGDGNVVGRRITVRGTPLTVAGVMPPGFGGHSAARIDVWVPFAATMQSPGWQSDMMHNVASIVMRIKEGETAAAAAAQATAALGDRYERVTLSPVAGAGISSLERRILSWLIGVSVIVLAIGLANAATLLLVRASRRRREMAIRAALGATRARLLAQTGIESLVLAAAGVAFSVLLAHWFDEAVRRQLLPSVIEHSAISGRALGAAAVAGALALAIASIVGLTQVPSYFRSADLARSTGSNPRARAHMSLLVAQAAFSFVLLAGAGVFGRSLLNLITQDFGLRMDGVVLVEFDRGPGTGDDLGELLESAVDGIRALPGVERATVVNVLPFSGFHVPPIAIPGMAEPPNVNGQLPFLIPTTPALLDILDLRVIAGRALTDADGRGAPVVMVNETMAQAAWKGDAAVGKCIRIGFDPSFDPMTATGPPTPSANVPCREVVGVVRDVRQRSLVPDGMEEHLMQYFVPFAQVPPPPGRIGEKPQAWGVLLRTSLGADALAQPVRRLVTNGRADVPFLHVRPYAQLLDRQIRPWRLGTILLSLFSALAIGVAAMGLYAAFAHMVHARRHEIAVRMAIGARPGGVLAMILREAVALAGAGIVAGAVVAMLAGRWVESMFFGTTPSDPLVLGGAALLLVAAAAAATFVPALTAARTDPSVLLRAE
ncbi:MAG TPA: ABC transporter permease [Vicinamibacterales bacterium]|nr:ABC transporter permease [Vicinamibacterales bacterium]